MSITGLDARLFYAALNSEETMMIVFLLTFFIFMPLSLSLALQRRGSSTILSFLLASVHGAPTFCTDVVYLYTTHHHYHHHHPHHPTPLDVTRSYGEASCVDYVYDLPPPPLLSTPLQLPTVERRERKNGHRSTSVMMFERSAVLRPSLIMHWHFSPASAVLVAQSIHR